MIGKNFFIIIFFCLTPDTYVNQGVAKALMFVFLFAYWGLFKLALKAKRRQCMEELEDLAVADKSWSLPKLNYKVKDTLNCLVKAKVERNPSFVRH